jgi:hypothetical protein
MGNGRAKRLPSSGAARVRLRDDCVLLAMNRFVARRVADDDSVEVLRVALRRHEALLPSLGTARVVGVPRRLSKECARDLLRVDDRDVERAVAEILDQIGSIQRPAGVKRARDRVPGVRGDGGKAVAEGNAQPPIAPLPRATSRSL